MKINLQDMELIHTTKRPGKAKQNAVLGILALLGLLSMLSMVHGNCSAWSSLLYSYDKSINKSVDAVLAKAPLVDGHNDFAIWIRAFYYNHIYQSNFTGSGKLYGQVDFPRLAISGLRGQFWSVYVECPPDDSDFSDETYREIIHDTLQQIDLVQRLTRAFSDHLTSAKSAGDVWAYFQSGRPQIAGLLGIEGLHQIGNSASVLRAYHALGVRCASLTHTCHNAYADSSEARNGPLHGGLSAAGRALVAEMNRLGMVVDLSHASVDTARDVLGAAAADSKAGVRVGGGGGGVPPTITRAPVMFSHSAAWHLCHHPRNVPDDVLRMLRANDGVIMVSFYPAHIHCGHGESEEEAEAVARLEHVADHIMYIGELIGFRHVGFGSDFDGMASGPRGLEDVSKYRNLVAELLVRGVSRADMEGVVGGNVLRILAAVEDVALGLRGEKPLEDDVKDILHGAK